MSPILALFCIGIVGLVAGTIAVWQLRRISRSELTKPRRWRLLRGAATLTGLAMGIGSFFLTGWTMYPVAEPAGTGHVVGIPFFAAYFDAQGRDYVGAITLVSGAANVIFWFLVPQIVLWLYAAIWRRATRQLTPRPIP